VSPDALLLAMYVAGDALSQENYRRRKWVITRVPSLSNAIVTSRELRATVSFENLGRGRDPSSRRRRFDHLRILFMLASGTGRSLGAYMGRKLPSSKERDCCHPPPSAPRSRKALLTR